MNNSIQKFFLYMFFSMFVDNYLIFSPLNSLFVIFVLRILGLQVYIPLYGKPKRFFGDLTFISTCISIR